MNLSGKVVVVTGGGHGIGRALCERFAAEGARAVIVADVDGEAASEVARTIGGGEACVDVASESDVQSLVDAALKKHGHIDLFCSNAGISWKVSSGPRPRLATDLGVNVMAHVYATRAALPRMFARKEVIFSTPCQRRDY